MEVKFGNFLDKVTTFFTGDDQIPWCDSDVVVVSNDTCHFPSPEKRVNALPFMSNKRKGLEPGTPMGSVSVTGLEFWIQVFLSLLLITSSMERGFRMKIGKKQHRKQIKTKRRTARKGKIQRRGEVYASILDDYSMKFRNWEKGCECEIAEAEKGSSNELKSECIMRLSWALVHSRHSDDVQRGIAMLEASLSGTSSSAQQMREKLYLLAVGYYRSGDYSRSRQLVERCLEIAPEWRQALNLKKVIEDRIRIDGVIGIGIAVLAVGPLVAGLLAVGIATAQSRKK